MEDHITLDANCVVFSRTLSSSRESVRLATLSRVGDEIPKKDLIAQSARCASIDDYRMQVKLPMRSHAELLARKKLTAGELTDHSVGNDIICNLLVGVHVPTATTSGRLSRSKGQTDRPNHNTGMRLCLRARGVTFVCPPDLRRCYRGAETGETSRGGGRCSHGWRL